MQDWVRRHSQDIRGTSAYHLSRTPPGMRRPLLRPQERSVGGLSHVWPLQGPIIDGRILHRRDSGIFEGNIRLGALLDSPPSHATSTMPRMHGTTQSR